MQIKSRKARLPTIPGAHIGPAVVPSVFITEMQWYACHTQLTALEENLVKSVMKLKKSHYAAWLEIK